MSTKGNLQLSQAVDRISSLEDLCLEEDFSAVHGPGLSMSFEISHGSPQSFILTGLSLAESSSAVTANWSRPCTVLWNTPASGLWWQSVATKCVDRSKICIFIDVRNFGLFYFSPQQQQLSKFEGCCCCSCGKVSSYLRLMFKVWKPLRQRSWASLRQNRASVISKRLILMDFVTLIFDGYWNSALTLGTKFP